MISKDRESLLAKYCPLRQLVTIVGDIKTLLILYVLPQNTKRYSEIQYKISGISKKMLIQTLRSYSLNRKT